MKTCTKCKKELDINCFHKNPDRKDGFDSRCRSCSSKAHMVWYNKNIIREREKRKQRDAEYRKNNPDAVKSSKLKYRYGITLEEKIKIIESQEGKCAICNRTITGKAVVDHNHKTGKVREILCEPCNQGLGFFGDSQITMSKAILYLKKHNT